MAEVHIVVGVAVIVANLVAGLWGAVAWIQQRPSVWFWYLLRVAQGTVIVQVVLGALLLIAGRINLFAEGMRTGAAHRELPEGVDFATLGPSDQRTIALRIVRRETGIMALAALLVVGFAIRAAQVSGKLF